MEGENRKYSNDKVVDSKIKLLNEYVDEEKEFIKEDTPLKISCKDFDNLTPVTKPPSYKMVSNTADISVNMKEKNPDHLVENGSMRSGKNGKISRRSSKCSSAKSSKCSSVKSSCNSSSDAGCDCKQFARDVCDPCCGDNVRALVDCGHCLGHSAVEVGHCVKNIPCKSFLKDIFSLETVKSKLPILRWIPKYRFKHLQGDLIAGVAVGLTVLPQGLAYAKIAQLPPQYGLYTSFMCCFMYGVFGTSKDLSIGTAAVLSLLTGNFALSPIEGDATYAIVLSLMTGCVQIAMSILHIGFVIDYLSHPVVHAFIQAAVLTIIFSQVDNWLGLTGIPREFFPQVFEIFKKLPETRIWDFVLGLVCMIILFMMKKMKLYKFGSGKNPSTAMKVFLYIVWLASTARNAIVVISATGFAAAIYINQTDPFKLTGDIPPGLPPFKPPSFSVTDGNTTYIASDIFQKLGTGIIVVPVISIVEAVAIAKSFARKNKYKVEPNQELLALGISNLLGSFVSAYPVTASFSRSAVNGQSGVKTPAGQFVTATMVVLVLAFATPLFFYIPDAALAAIIIMAVSDMFDFTPLIEMWEIKKIDLISWFATFILGLIFGIETGIIIGILISACILLYPDARPGMQIKKEADYTVVTLNQGFVYPSVEYFNDHIMEKVIEDDSYVGPQRKAVILDFTHVTSLDSSSGMCLKNMTEDFTKIGAVLIFCNVKKNVNKILEDCQIKNLYLVDTVDEAISHSRKLRNIEEPEKNNNTKHKQKENSEVPTFLITEHDEMKMGENRQEAGATNWTENSDEVLPNYNELCHL